MKKRDYKTDTQTDRQTKILRQIETARAGE